ncbi:nucleotide disphospho-sugar-binding domain-containing protein [Lentzea sp. NPDC004782]|uniref:nucleotide disphospho-sugar-binding domain-containing protein n=1 Tax=Lentzea sp. NPDC004782 TaxID=3154458 RepID=UPI0033B220E4
MRVLVTSCPGFGHLYPLIPLSWALTNAGHDVLLALPDQFAQVGATTGLQAAAVGPVSIREVFANSNHALYSGNVTEALIEHVTEHYAKITRFTVSNVIGLAERWRPDAVMHTPWEYAGPIAAARLGVPLVRHTWGVALPAELAPAEAETLAPVHREHGFPDDPALEVDVCPPALQYPDAPSGLPMAYTAYNGSGVLPSWLFDPRTGPRICVTLGSVPVPGGEHDRVLRTVLRGLEKINAEVLVITGGGALDPGTVPANTRVVDWVPLNQVLKVCDAVVHHGGSGTTMTSLHAGLPQLALPQMCDQHRHADRAEAVGAAAKLVGDDITAESVRDHVQRLLGDPAPRVAAEKIRDEMRALPPPAAVVSSLTALVEAQS